MEYLALSWSPVWDWSLFPRFKMKHGIPKREWVMEWHPLPGPGLPGAPPIRSLSRRALLWSVPSVVLAVSGDSGIFHVPGRRRLHSSTVAITDNQARVLVPPHAEWTEPGSRVLSQARHRLELLEQEATWQARNRISVTLGPADSEAARLALLDLRVLLGGRAPVAAWSPQWRYVWPRDSAFVVAALAATGHSDEAAGILAFLQQVQSAGGTFQARYLPGVNRTPDHRRAQLDGTGWSLWGLLKWSQAMAEPTRAVRLRAFLPLLERASTACLRLTNGGLSLPPPSPDYWEMPTRQVTLGNAALLLVGLQAAARLYAGLGDSDRSTSLTVAAHRYRSVISKAFSPNGYPRIAGDRSRDAAVCFLLPPFVDEVDPKVLEAWQLARFELRRPAGGFAPGASWKQDGISWTPETALFAMTAAAIGDRRHARSGLDWLLAHRTIAGSFPEKVNRDGSPASAAPLAWTTAATLLALVTDPTAG